MNTLNGIRHRNDKKVVPLAAAQAAQLIALPAVASAVIGAITA